jgi:hypothetical protein
MIRSIRLAADGFAAGERFRLAYRRATHRIGRLPVRRRSGGILVWERSGNWSVYFSVSVTSGKLKGSHLFANVSQASRNRE